MEALFQLAVYHNVYLKFPVTNVHGCYSEGALCLLQEGKVCV